MSWYELYSMGNIVNDYAISLYGDRWQSRLIMVMFEMDRNIKSLCCISRTNTVLGQLYFNKETNKFIEKEIRFVVTRCDGQGRGWLEGSPKDTKFSVIK